MNTNLRYSLVAANVLVGIFAGVLVAAAIAISPSLAKLDALNYTIVKQTQISVLQVAMSIITTLYTVLAIYILVVAKKQGYKKLFSLTLWALILVLICLGYSAFTDIPYNQAILKWDPNSTPDNWTSVRDAWDFANRLRTIPTILGFILQTKALLFVNNEAEDKA